LNKRIEEFPPHGKGRTYPYCRPCHRTKLLAISHTPHDRWLRSKNRAKRKGIEWQIDEDTFSRLISQQCHYCGGELGISGVGLDRKEPKGGYVFSNVVSCCRQCNIVKNDHFSYEEMMLLSLVLTKIRIAKVAKENMDYDP
jgi:hypothetical protein